MENTSSPTMAAPALFFKDVLEVPLLCFEAAADAMPRFCLAYAIPEPKNNFKFPCYRVWSTKDLSYTPPPSSALPTLTFPPVTLPAALGRWNMCESFTHLLGNEVDRLVNEIFGANAEWMVTEPLPAFAMIAAGHLGAPTVPWHSVLKIIEKNGNAWIMDGTCEQFNWPHATWLLDYNIFFATRVKDADIRLAEPWFKNTFRKNITWFWDVARGRLEELFDEMDYGSMFAMPHDEGVQPVRALAKAKFEGVWEEACGRAGISVDSHM